MEYKKVTQGLPEPNRKVMTYNGETEFKNRHDGKDFVHQLKYPITHWRYCQPLPPFEEVRKVRDNL